MFEARSPSLFVAPFVLRAHWCLPWVLYRAFSFRRFRSYLLMSVLAPSFFISTFSLTFLVWVLAYLPMWVLANKIVCSKIPSPGTSAFDMSIKTCHLQAFRCFSVTSKSQLYRVICKLCVVLVLPQEVKPSR